MCAKTKERVLVRSYSSDTICCTICIAIYSYDLTITVSLFDHLPFITGSNCSTSYCNRISHWWVYQSVTSANGLFEWFWHYTVKQEDSNNLFGMTLGWWGGHFLFGWAVRSHQWLWHWAWRTSHKVWSFFTLLLSPTHFCIISINLPSFHTCSRLLTENLSVHMIINCYL